MATDRRALVRRLMDEGPFEGEIQAREAVRATLTALGGGLTSDEARLLAQDLERPWADVLAASRFVRALTLEEFYRLVSFHEGRRLAIAMEHAQLVCRALHDAVSDATRELLAKHLPELAPLWSRVEVPDEVAGPDRSRAVAAPEHTLASGSPGASRPLSTARPTSSHPLSDSRPDTAQTHSVVRADNPHGDTKLSSSQGLTQERERANLSRSQRSVRR
jgi:uncharacterized protein (DUF2267 family)